MLDTIAKKVSQTVSRHYVADLAGKVVEEDGRDTEEQEVSSTNG